MSELNHRGYKVHVSSDGLFYPEFVQYTDAVPTYKEAKKVIDVEIDRTRAQVSLNLPVLDSGGNRLVIDRVHTGTGFWILRGPDGKQAKPAEGRFHDPDLYFDRAAVPALLERLADLQAGVEATLKLLDTNKVNIRVKPYGSGRPSQDSIERWRAEVAAQFETPKEGGSDGS